VTTIDQREETRYRQDVLLSYRAWLSYLEAQQIILAASGQAEAGVDPFEGASAAQERADAARQRLAALPTEKRDLFDAVYEQDRQRIQRELDAKAPVRGGTIKRVDPDEVARRALTHLLEEARGFHRTDRRGLVPRGKADAVKWLAIDLSDIGARPPAKADYELAAGRQQRRRSLITQAVLAGVALLGILAFALLPGRLNQTQTPAGAPVANGAQLTPWAITAVAPSDGSWSLPVQRAEMHWPAACANEANTDACWLSTSFRPLELCLPAERMAELTTLRLSATNGQPDRVFALSTETASSPDLVIRPCSDGSGDVPPLLGALRTVEPTPELAPGVAAPSGFTVTSITVQGQSEDATIPDGTLTLSVLVEDTETARDWIALDPTLLLADGAAKLPKHMTRDGMSLQFDYSIDEQPEPFAVRWQVVEADQVVRYRAILEPPPSRGAVLRTRLRVENVSATASQQTMAVTLTLHNTATTPLVVEAADLGFQTTAARRDVAAPALRQPLAPDERRTVTLELPLESGVLTVGPFRYELAVGR
jgi:hypothetical protein